MEGKKLTHRELIAENIIYWTFCNKNQTNLNETVSFFIYESRTIDDQLPMAHRIYTFTKLDRQRGTKYDVRQLIQENNQGLN
jgi:hypothetical protein